VRGYACQPRVHNFRVPASKRCRTEEDDCVESRRRWPVYGRSEFGRDGGDKDEMQEWEQVGWVGHWKLDTPGGGTDRDRWE